MQRSRIFAPVFLAMVALPLASAQAEAFVEASTGVQKIGLDLDGLRPFLAGNVSLMSGSKETVTAYTVGAGLDWTRPVEEIDLGVRGYGLVNGVSESSTNVYSAIVTLIAKKKFGALSVGGGIGPAFSIVDFDEDDVFSVALGSELFVSLNF